MPEKPGLYSLSRIMHRKTGQAVRPAPLNAALECLLYWRLNFNLASFLVTVMPPAVQGLRGQVNFIKKFYIAVNAG